MTGTGRPGRQGDTGRSGLPRRQTAMGGPCRSQRRPTVGTAPITRLRRAARRRHRWLPMPARNAGGGEVLPGAPPPQPPPPRGHGAGVSRRRQDARHHHLPVTRRPIRPQHALYPASCPPGKLADKAKAPPERSTQRTPWRVAPNATAPSTRTAVAQVHPVRRHTAGPPALVPSQQVPDTHAQPQLHRLAAQSALGQVTVGTTPENKTPARGQKGSQRTGGRGKHPSQRRTRRRPAARRAKTRHCAEALITQQKTSAETTTTKADEPRLDR